MILLFNHIPVTLEGKIQKMLAIAQASYGSDFYDVAGQRWLGDNLTVDSLFPKWILKEANENPMARVVTSQQAVEIINALKSSETSDS